MVGLDRASIWVLVDAHIELIDIGIRKKYRHILGRKALGDTQNYSIGKENINEIKVISHLNKTSTIKIDFSYPRSNAATNLYPLTSEIEKKIVDDKILNLVREISLDNEITIHDLFYDYFELAVQEYIGSFYKFNNLIMIFYRALAREYDTKDSLVYSNYRSTMDRFYSTGFLFKIMVGWQIRLYSKAHEHNKKNLKKQKGALIKLEHKITQSIIKRVCQTNSVNDLTIKDITNSVKNHIGEKLFKLIVNELSRNDKILEKKFFDFDSRELSNLVRDYEEWIYDEKILNSIITRNSKRSRAQIERYRRTVKIALRESQIRSSPYRDNFKNIERLELFINKLLLIECEVKCSYKKHLTFNQLKNHHKHEGFLVKKKVTS
ncbi:hypothetical protein [Psychrilyobacter atlanticus]|uniref:hypothetical protein n=1 Tax=Psychrilyobacter atlanticus TaxID=271091 RepID=UPI000419D67D|nr:hypothetical protein [Psychrilyobacter atlanticus]